MQSTYAVGSHHHLSPYQLLTSIAIPSDRSVGNVLISPHCEIKQKTVLRTITKAVRRMKAKIYRFNSRMCIS